MNTDERIHTYCRTSETADNTSIGVYLQDTQKLMEKPESSLQVMDNHYVNAHYDMQKQFNDEIKDSSIKLSTSYWDNVFESMKLMNRYLTNSINIGINNSSIA